VGATVLRVALAPHEARYPAIEMTLADFFSMIAVSRLDHRSSAASFSAS
jgi:hypothetical protein